MLDTQAKEKEKVEERKKALDSRREFVRDHTNMKVRELAELLGVHRRTIEQDIVWLKKNRLYKTRSQKRDEEIAKLTKDGLTPKQISEKLSICDRDVYYRQVKMGAR